MRDVDLAPLYGVTTFNLNKAVKRNNQRFPDDFMFQLTPEEAEPLKFQIGMSKITGRGGRRTLPYAFTQSRDRAYMARIERIAGTKRRSEPAAFFRALIKAVLERLLCAAGFIRAALGSA
jgi:hypothetical protein